MYLQKMIVGLICLLCFGGLHAQNKRNVNIKDSPTTIIGFNHIGISVKNLDAMVDFYQKATGFEVMKREKVRHSKTADILYGKKGMAYETVTLKAPNMLLELTQFADQSKAEINKMPPQGPGMTHTCYQSPTRDSGFDKFVEAGVEMLSSGNPPVDLGGYGVTYAYAHDPEGNMLELEQLDERYINPNGKDSTWLKQYTMRMTQVALISPDIEKMIAFYQKVLELPPRPISNLANNPRLNEIANVDSVVLKANWFDMDVPAKMLELMQYDHPKTAKPSGKKGLTDLGYSFSFEVEDIQKEYKRLEAFGVQFVSDPQILGEFWIVFAHDVDGNVFSLRQPTSKDSIYSAKSFIY